MYEQVEKPKENKSRAAANQVTQKKSNVKQGFGFVDNRSENISQLKLQEMTHRHSVQPRQPIQKKQIDCTIQRQVDVLMGTNTAKKKQVYARGDVEGFQGGTAAGKTGWVGVTKYRARYTISDDDNHEDKGESGTLDNDFTNPEAGHILANQNGGDGGDPENVFAQDGGTNNGVYKSFENDMRKDLNKYEDDDDVEFVCYLSGEAITQGTIKDEGLDYASDISSDDLESD